MKLNKLNPRWDAYDRRDSFWLQLLCLKYLGLWPPEDTDQATRNRYIAYGWALRIMFLHLYALTQALYFKDVKDINDIANALFVLMTQVTLIYKLEKFNYNIARIQACLRKLNCTLYHPKQREEFSPVLQSMSGVFWLMIFLMFVAIFTIIMWVMSPAFDNERRLPVPAWFPVDYHHSDIVYGVLFLYQTIGIVMSATYNFSTDTMFSGLMLHINGQIVRLGSMVKKLGHDVPPERQLVATDAEWKEMRKRIDHHSKVYGTMYAKVTECVLFHKDILSFGDEVQDIFQGSIFAQVCASVIIICMTLLQATGDDVTMADLLGCGFYLLVMTSQVFIFCYVGNEISYTTDKFTEFVGFSNYFKFDKRTSQAMIFFLQMTLKDVHIKVGSVLKVTLNLHTFLQIMKLSYSYLAVLQSMESE
ncbi:AGAP009640-PA [Anopheles gambiae str. PEST]|uniref:Odorant receptor Or1 n=2 Tax=Anopheles gambiae TaxID=7165 RepID=OR1_ANOGA|nr:RecName: Full=Odorant receptor Or1; AltName: Full=AgOr1 [Anopheles gambiae]AAL35506.1 putative odorant receptor Or1 [Anopheles gambiae]EAA13838.1 AGAP009640-PA [Anopheles gambiae str. PEST]